MDVANRELSLMDETEHKTVSPASHPINHTPGLTQLGAGTHRGRRWCLTSQEGTLGREADA